MTLKRKLSELIPGYTTTLDLIIVGVFVGVMLVGLITRQNIPAVLGIIGIVAFIFKEAVNDRK